MAEGWVQLAADGFGKKVRNLLLNIAGTDVYQQVVTLADSTGAEVVPATQATAALIKAKTDNLDIALSALRDAIAGGKTQADIVTALDVTTGVIRNAAELAASDPRTGFQPMAARAGSRDSVGQR